MHLRHWRLVMYLVLILSLVATSSFAYGAERKSREANLQFQEQQTDFQKFTETAKRLADFKKTLSAYIDQGIDVTTALQNLDKAQDYLIKGLYEEVISIISETEASLKQAQEKKLSDDALALQLKQQTEELARQKEAEEEQKRGDLKGVIGTGTAPLSGATVSLVLGKEVLSKVTTDTKGFYAFHYTGGTYSVTAEKSGYVKSTKEGVVIQAGQTTALDLNLVKVPTATPKPSPTSSSDTTSYSAYRALTVSTERGSFSVKLLTVELGSGKVRVITDTAADGDCTNNCPVKAVKDYVTAHGGFAGVNGTYFCPTAYTDCAGKTNSFYWKVYNSRLQVMINQSNGLGEDAPFFVFDSAGKSRFFSAWIQYPGSGFSTYAGISSRPILISGGKNVLDVNTLDEKEKTTKTIRTGFGMKGTTAYVAVLTSATIIDLASVMNYFGVDSAMNLDGGGSSALYYNGSFKSGPGRNVPNAVIFKELP